MKEYNLVPSTRLNEANIKEDDYVPSYTIANLYTVYRLCIPS